MPRYYTTLGLGIFAMNKHDIGAGTSPKGDYWPFLAGLSRISCNHNARSAIQIGQEPYIAPPFCFKDGADVRPLC